MPGVLSLPALEKSEAQAPYSAHACTVREDLNLSESLKIALTQLPIRAKSPCHGVVASVFVVVTCGPCIYIMIEFV